MKALLLILTAIALVSRLAVAGEPLYLTHKELCKRSLASEKPRTCEECKDGGLRNLNALVANLKTMDSWIAAVPPSDAEYLDREGSFSEHMSETRLIAAMRNRHYPAWKLRREIGEMNEAIKRLSKWSTAFPPTEKNKKLEKISKALELTENAANVSAAFSVYTSRDSTTPVLTMEQHRSGGFLTAMSFYLIREYAKCIISDFQEYLPPE